MNKAINASASLKLDRRMVEQSVKNTSLRIGLVKIGNMLKR